MYVNTVLFSLSCLALYLFRVICILNFTQRSHKLSLKKKCFLCCYFAVVFNFFFFNFLFHFMCIFINMRMFVLIVPWVYICVIMKHTYIYPNLHSMYFVYRYIYNNNIERALISMESETKRRKKWTDEIIIKRKPGNILWAMYWQYNVMLIPVQCNK